MTIEQGRLDALGSVLSVPPTCRDIAKALSNKRGMAGRADEAAIFDLVARAIRSDDVWDWATGSRLALRGEESKEVADGVAAAHPSTSGQALIVAVRTVIATALHGRANI